MLLAALLSFILGVAVLKAQEYYNKALDFEKSGFTYYEEGYFWEAIKEFENARELHYSNPKLLSLQANSYLYIKNYSKAERTYKQLLEKDKKNIWAMNQLAVLYIITEKYDRATDVLKSALAVNPEFTGSLILMARAYEKSEEFSEARKYYDLAEGQQNNILITSIAKKGKERVSFSRSYHNSTSWLRGRRMPILKDAETVFPVVEENAFEGSGGKHKSSPKISMISIKGVPVYYKQHREAKPKVVGLAIDVDNGPNRLDIGIPAHYDKIEDFPVVPIAYSTFNIKIDKDSPAITEVWPKPLAKVSDPGYIQVRLTGLSMLPGGLSGADFGIYSIRGMKKVPANIKFEFQKGLVYLKPEKPLPRGKYIAYFDPNTRNDRGRTTMRAKTWLISVKNDY